MHWKLGKLEQEAPGGNGGGNGGGGGAGGGSPATTGGGGVRPNGDRQQTSIAVAAALAVIDRLQREVAQAGPRLEDARVKRAERESARLAYKHGRKSPIAARAALALRDRVAVAAVALAAAQRARVPAVTVDADASVIHGRVVDDRRAGRSNLEVHLKAGDRSLASAHTDADGYFALTVPGDAADGRRVLLQPAGGGRASSVRVVVLHGDQIVHEDKTAMSVRLGRATYREITLCK